MTRQNAKPKTPVWKILLSLVVLLVLGIGFAYAPRVAFVLFFLLCLSAVFFGNATRRFYRTEQRLATSQVRSVAMGLAELRGKVLLDVPLVSPITNTRCAGYALIVEQSSKDSEGRISWSEVSRDIHCNDFRLADATGEIRVVAAGISLFDGKSADDLEGLMSGQRQGEIVLREGDEVVLIGDAAEQDGRAVMTRGKQKNALFALARAADVDLRRDMAPLARAGGFYAMFLALIAAGILSLDPAQMAQLHLPGPDTYAQMASLGPQYGFFAWIYRNDGVPLPFMAAFGLMGAIFVLLFATRLLLPKGMRNAVQAVLWGLLAIGVIAGAPTTLLLVLADIDPLKVLLIWIVILAASLLFSMTQQRALRAAANSMLKHSPRTDGDSDDAIGVPVANASADADDWGNSGGTRNAGK